MGRYDAEDMAMKKKKKKKKYSQQYLIVTKVSQKYKILYQTPPLFRPISFLNLFGRLN